MPEADGISGDCHEPDNLRIEAAERNNVAKTTILRAPHPNPLLGEERETTFPLP